MIITNCQIIYKDGIEKGSVRFEAGKITGINVLPAREEDHLDAKGLYLAPGFIDCHIHGAGGCDVMDGTEEAICHMAKVIATHGTTSFLPTTMTAPLGAIHQALSVIKKLKEKSIEGAQVLGAHLEGPFLNLAAAGAQNGAYLCPPSINAFEEMTAGYQDAVVAMTVAPELMGARELITYARERGIICSAGHTHGTYEQLMAAFEWGISHVTHFYHGMTPFSHRAPGVVGAVFDSRVTTELIADGVHSTYPALRLACREKKADGILLITDGMRACCMPEGIYSLGGQQVIVSQGAARLKDGKLAGSILTMDQAVRNMYKHGQLSLHEVIQMASYQGARFCGMADCKGQIAEGYDADLVLFDEDINIKGVWIQGKAWKKASF